MRVDDGVVIVGVDGSPSGEDDLDGRTTTER
jgi:hypothetical protein